MATSKVKIIEINGVKYKKLNLNTEFTVRASNYAKELVAKLLDNVVKNQSQTNFESIADLNYILDAMALMYIELDDTNQPVKFTDAQYEKQREDILDSTLDLDSFASEVSEFVNFFMRRFISSFRTLSAVNQADGTKPKL